MHKVLAYRATHDIFPIEIWFEILKHLTAMQAANLSMCDKKATEWFSVQVNSKRCSEYIQELNGFKAVCKALQLDPKKIPQEELLVIGTHIPANVSRYLKKSATYQASSCVILLILLSIIFDSKSYDSLLNMSELISPVTSLGGLAYEFSQKHHAYPHTIGDYFTGISFSDNHLTLVLMNMVRDYVRYGELEIDTFATVEILAFCVRYLSIYLAVSDYDNTSLMIKKNISHFAANRNFWFDNRLAEYASQEEFQQTVAPLLQESFWNVRRESMDGILYPLQLFNVITIKDHPFLVKIIKNTQAEVPVYTFEALTSPPTEFVATVLEKTENCLSLPHFILTTTPYNLPKALRRALAQ